MKHILLLQSEGNFTLYSRVNIPEKGNQEENIDRKTEITGEGLLEKVGLEMGSAGLEEFQ